MGRLVPQKNRLVVLSSLVHSFRSSSMPGILILIFTYIVVFLIVLSAVLPEKYDLKVGDILEEPIKAPRDVVDRLATQERIEEAKASVSAIYRLEPQITNSVMQEAGEIFDEIDHIRSLADQKLNDYLQNQKAETDDQKSPDENARNNTDRDRKAKYESVNIEEILDDNFYEMTVARLPIRLSREDLITCITADREEIDVLKTQLLKTLKELLDTGIKQEDLPEARGTVREEIQKLPVSNNVKLMGITIGLSLVRRNMLYDYEATEHEKNRVASQVEKVVYKKGQYIVQAGQPVTENQIAVLKDLGLLKDGGGIDTRLVIGTGTIVFIILLFVALYFVYYEKEMVKRPVMLLMISLITSIVLGLCRFTSRFNVYLIPVAMGGMLLTILISARDAMVVNISLSLLIGIILENRLDATVMALVGSMFGIYMVNKLNQRSRLVLAGLGVGIVNMAIIAGFELFTSRAWLESIRNCLWGGGSGILSSILTVGTLPIWENVFGVITPIKLIELSNPNHPVLKKLLIEAPGTYHHSIIVANLAESAANAIGADSLLARVGSYYHDIGKLKRPYFFKENQISPDNPHDKIKPQLSVRIITSHTKDGVELAKKYKLPVLIQDFILQHHGTMPVLYFYHKAKNEKSGREVKLDDFRYSGPKPASREAAIVMMADAVEAAVRALSNPRQGKIKELIYRLIKERLEDGQLDECDLTLKDLNCIAKAFIGVINGIFHSRIEYPDISLREERGEEYDGDRDYQ